MKQVNFISVMTASLLLIGCGGGASSSSSSPQTTESPKTGTGYYVDAAVKGVNYVCGTQTGVTDAVGAFTFEKDEKCTFKLGDLVLREINATSLEDNVSIFEDNKDVAQLLQTLDSDNNASNGINLLPEVHEVLREQNIVEIPKNDTELLEIRDGLKEKRPEEYQGELVSDEQVDEHLAQTLQDLKDEGRRTQNDVEAENQGENTGSTETPTQDGNTGSTETPTQGGNTGSTETPTQDGNTGSTETPTQDGNTGSTETPTQGENTGSTETLTQDGNTGSTETPTQGGNTGSTETPSQGENNETRPEVPNMDDNNTGSETPTNTVDENKFIKPLTIPALAAYEMIEGYKVFQ